MEETTIETHEQYLMLKEAIKEYEAHQRKKKKRYTDPQKRDIIAETVRDYYNETQEMLKMKCRDRALVQTRQITYYFVRKYTKHSLTKTGKMFGQDHATVIHARGNIIDLVQTDTRIRNDISTIENQLLNKGVMPTILSLEKMRYNTSHRRAKPTRRIDTWWTIERVDLLKKAYGKIGIIEIAKLLSTTPIKVQQKLEELNIKAA